MQSSYLWFCPFHPRQTLAGRNNPAINAVQYLQNLHLKNLYIHCTTNYVKITAFTKNYRPMAFVTTVHSLKANVTTLNPLRQHVPFKTYLHFQFKIGPQYSLTHSLALSLSFSHRHAFGSYFIDFPFLYIFFWCTFSFIPYSVSGLLLLSLSLWLTVIAFSRSYSVSLFWTVRYRLVSFLHCMCLWTQNTSPIKDW